MLFSFLKRAFDGLIEDRKSLLSIGLFPIVSVFVYVPALILRNNGDLYTVGLSYYLFYAGLLLSSLLALFFFVKRGPRKLRGLGFLLVVVFGWQAAWALLGTMVLRDSFLRNSVFDVAVLLGVPLAILVLRQMVAVFSVLMSVIVFLHSGVLQWDHHRDRVLRMLSDKDKTPKTSESTKGNVYHILLDGFQSQLFDEAVQASSFKNSRGDFTHFKGFRTNSMHTRWSLGIFSAGSYYKGDRRYDDWERDAFKRGYAKALADEGIKVSQYYMFNNFCIIESYCAGFAAALVSPHSSPTLALIDLWFISLWPNLLKQWKEGELFFGNKRSWDYNFSVTSLWSNRQMKYDSRDTPAFVTSFFDKIIYEEKQRADSGEYVFIHSLLPHGPFVLDENCQYHMDRSRPPLRSSVIGQHICSLRLLERFVQRLKDLGRYDNSLIIVHSDHGSMTPFNVKAFGFDFPDVDSSQPRFVYYEKENVERIPDDYIHSISSGVMFVKYPSSDAKSQAVDENPYSLVDIAPTVLTHFGFESRAQKTEGHPIQIGKRGGKRRFFFMRYHSFHVTPKFFYEYQMVGDRKWRYMGKFAPPDGVSREEWKRNPR